MSKRRWKQFFYGLVFFLIFFALIGLVAFKWNGSKVCLTQAQRNQVAGVGCSGSCQTCQTAMARIKIESANVILYADGTMDLYAQVSDRDQGHGLKNFSYQFLVQGNQPNQAEVFAGQSYVFPSEQKYVIESNLKQPNFFVAKVSFNLNFNQADWLPLASANSNVAINLLNSQFKNKTLSFEVSNGGSIVYKKINLNFLILDQNNNIIGTAKSYLDQLQPLGRYQGILNLPPLSGQSNLKQPNFFVAKVSFNLNFNQADWLPLASANSNVAINLLNSQFKNKTLSFEVSNGGSIVYKKINLNFLILDQNNNIIGTAKSYLDQLQPLGRYQGILNLPPLSGQPVNLIFQPDSNLYTD